jgi:hypothetical protein
MWDSFTSGVAISSMRNDKNGKYGNDFAQLEYMNITVVTSNKPYGVHDGSNPLFDGHTTPKFGLQKVGVHSGHVQTGITDSFCRVKGSNKGRCEVLYGHQIVIIDSCIVLFLMKKLLLISVNFIEILSTSLRTYLCYFVMMSPDRQR